MTKSNENPRTLTITASGIENLQSLSDLQRPETGSMLEWHELTETILLRPDYITAAIFLFISESKTTI